MPPSTSIVSSVVVAAEDKTLATKNQCHEENESKPKGKGHYLQNRFGFVTPLVWPNIIMITALHLFSLYTLLIMLPMHFCKLQTILFGKSIMSIFILWPLLYGCFAGMSETWRCLNSR